MSESRRDISTLAPTRPSPMTQRIAAWLAIAAAPTFAIMAIMTTFTTGEGMGATCGSGPSSLVGMTPMYLLMCVFHTSPWLELMGHRWKREP